MPRARCFALLALLPFATVARADTPAAQAAPAVKVERDITYSTAGGEKLRLDIAAPAAGGPYPAVLLLHGGAWRTRSHTDLSRPGRDPNGNPIPGFIEQIAARGYVVATAAYRFAPKHKFPAQLDDARTAVRFLRANAKKYNLNPDRLGVGGFSSGGHLALLLALADRPPLPAGAEYPDQSDRVRCVLSWAGPTDLKLYAASPGLEEAYMVPFLGEECRTDPAVYRRASPISYVSKDDPPVLLVHGTADLMVPVIHSERLEEKLRAAGVPVELVAVTGAGHIWGGPSAVRGHADMVRFLDEHLKGKK